MSKSQVEYGGAQMGTDDAGTPSTAVLLWAVLGSGLAWAFHLLGSYVAIAWSCTTGRLDTARPLLLVISIIAFAGIASSAWLSWRSWHVAREVDRPEDDSWDARMGERTARVSFLMVSGLFLALLFGLGVFYETISIAMAPVCEAGIAP